MQSMLCSLPIWKMNNILKVGNIYVECYIAHIYIKLL